MDRTYASQVRAARNLKKIVYSLIDTCRHDDGMVAARAGKMTSCTSASNDTVSAYHAGDTLWKRSYATVPACRAVLKLRVVV